MDEKEKERDLRFREDYQGLTIGYEPKVLRLDNDPALSCYLDGKGNRALALAEHMRARYASLLGRELAVSADSVAIEILGHVFVDRLAEWAETLAERAPHLLKYLDDAMEKVQRHTDVIDIGERAVDGNRWFWDALQPFRGLVFAICGQQEDHPTHQSQA